MAIEFQLPNDRNSIIKVLGVGGGGGNAVRNMYEHGIKGVDFIIANTDVQAMDRNPVPNKIQLGENLTQGLGCGANPEIGRESALESIEEVRKALSDGTRMVFVTAGMGGGTGTGGAPVIANLAREMGILTVGIVTTPFKFEGDWRMNIAMHGIAELEQCVDSLLVINNANLMQICPKNIRQKDAYLMADQVLLNAAKGIAEIITVDGYVNVDFADVQTIMRNSGTALMGSAVFAGDDRAEQAVEEALSSPLLDNRDIAGATGILLNISASEDSLTLDEIESIGEYVKNAAGADARIIFGQVYNEELGDQLSVTVIACGFDAEKRSTTDTTPPKADKKKYTPVQGALPLDSPSEPASEEKEQPLATPEQKREPTPKPMSLDERLQRVQSQDYDIHNPQKVRQLEEQPAYLRRRVNLQEDGASPRNQLSRLSLDSDGDGKYKLRDNNSFLFDNVD